ncbi:acyl-CoA synthetase [Nocardioides bizhenqiangii]|uniref:Acyl-CoA synthetase n=1 Tax=Nocardioides bizhenqiangii TaxID=3095076 RepID=A0ABZ0ZPA6_9ACTN|nr:acyl-CoA synthetase [Nocardioides sp. HM61]WQQ25313.1 acyl-CoA synthetase [Nocardioides sp. HM61]
MITLPIQIARRASQEAVYASYAFKRGALGIDPPWKVAQIGHAVWRYGMLGGIPAIASIRHGRDRAAVVDELGTMTYGELDDSANALANHWRGAGLAPGDGVSILARNHRWFLVATYAAARCGARIVLLNTDFAGPQIRDVAAREGTDCLVHDDEYGGLLADVDTRLGRIRAWTDTSTGSVQAGGGDDTIAGVVAYGDTSPAPRSGQDPKVVLLTSGTTGTPKGAPRAEPRSLAPIGALLSRVPFDAKGVVVLPAPMFHTLGFAQALLNGFLGSTLVVRRRFDPALVLEDLSANRATGMVAVPVMLQKMVELGDEAFAEADLSELTAIFVAGSQLGAELATRSTQLFGPVIHNMYGSTEVAYATIATPEDLAAEPGCVGRPVMGAVVKIFDDDGREVAPGATGRIFVGNDFQFEGYTGGGDKDRIDGLMSTGDVGHFDAAGRLFIDGRDDDMIVSGGENVFPGEVEELLFAHDAVREAAAIGVPDERFGQRLRAFVVLNDGAALTADEVKAYVAQNLARYKTPRDVVFVDELPRNPTGKVLKRQLSELEL